jgi:hypothetical protein
VSKGNAVILRSSLAACAVVIFLSCSSISAHVGSPNIFFEGDAGPYPVRVMIRPPRVVPGLAEISVRVKTNGVSSVSVLPARWDTGRKGAPPPDVANAVKGETNLFASQLWLMNSGAYSVFVNVEGAAGKGVAIVPVNSLALSRLDMPRWMEWMFLGLGVVLFISLAALVGAAVREGSLPIGQQIDIDRRKRARLAIGFAIVLASGAVAIGNQWWTVVDRNFETRRLYKPIFVSASIQDGALILDAPKKDEGNDFTPLIPDHGKMMHLFVIEKQTGRAFAHLHPVRSGTGFRATVPPLPPGAYHIYGDVTHESGLTETWLSQIKLSERASSVAPVKDDAFLIAEPSGDRVTLSNGPTIAWENKSPLRANDETTLQFSVRKPDGSLAQLEPYLGMYAHAVIWKTNGHVFTHLHPLGTISMTSQLLFAKRESGEYLANQPLDVVCGAPPKTVAFPYAFPEPGNYRVWVQVKVNGAIQTAVFNADVL